jgi:hypothetical protein
MNVSCELGKSHWGRCQISWATQSGWILSMVLESPTNADICRIVHETPRVIHRNADGTIIHTGKKSWSLPQNSVGVDLSGDIFCMCDVPVVTKILTHHDKFVLDSQPKIVRSTKRSLLIFSEHGKQSISLPKKFTQVPQSLSVHPNCEWLVVADGRRLHLLTHR